MNIPEEIARILSLKLGSVNKVLELLDEGATIPFLARYRKEQTGGLDEEQLRSIQSHYGNFKALEDRRSSIQKSLTELGLWQGDLKDSIARATTLLELEDLYLPHRPKRKTRASKAKELGLEPLARQILQQPRNTQPLQVAQSFVKGEVATPQDALAGARDIVAEQVAENAKVRQTVRDKTHRFARLRAEKKKNAVDEKGVFRSYYEFDTPLSRIQSHQTLALNRGESEKILRVWLEWQERDWRDVLHREYRPFQNSPWGEQLQLALDDSAKRLLLPSIEREVRKALTEEAQTYAIKVFGDNLESLLLVPPLGKHIVLALDPGFRSGCKLAVVDSTGKLLATDTIYPHPPQKQEAKSLEVLQKHIKKHAVTVIAIGNGTASRETEQLVAQMETPYLIVSEAGASVYSASPLARLEFPDLDVSIRGAISIARRVLDPLAELIKIDPKSVGVGMYQHDLDEAKLDQALAQVVESVVHKVGVELNTASASLLSHLGGIGPKTAENIIDYREKNGPFPDRTTLKKVKGLGPKAFELAAGFIRIRDGKNPLDATAIHPESYKVAKQVMTLAKNEVATLEWESLKDKIDCPAPTLKDIVEQLQKPGRDPREELPAPVLRSGVLSMGDLYPGLTLSGTVRNVVPFGSFVDIGVKQDGLIHVSKLKNRALSVGQVIEVEVLEIDEQRGRISLGLA